MGQKTKVYKKRENLLINSQNFYDGRKMTIDAFTNKIFPKAPTGFEDDGDRGLQPDSLDSSFSTTDNSDKSDESDFTAEIAGNNSQKQ